MFMLILLYIRVIVDRFHSAMHVGFDEQYILLVNTYSYTIANGAI